MAPDALMSGVAQPEPHMNVSSLSGIRVLDLSRVLAGPLCTQILADHGAEVIKVESPSGDDTRGWGPPFDGSQTSAYFNAINRNKRGVALDLGNAADRAVVLRLLDGADVLIENYKKGTLEKWGLGYDAVLRERFPKLVYCRITGFGDSGPLGGLPGYDAVVQAYAGFMSVNGEEGGQPIRSSAPVVDIATGLNAAIGILMALQARTVSGVGQAVEVSLFDSALSLLHPHLANFLASGAIPQRVGNAHLTIAPYDLFKTGSGYLYLAVGNNRQFETLCRLLEIAETSSDARYRSNALRSANRITLKQELEAALADKDTEDIAEALMRAGVPAAKVQDLSEVVDSQHFKHRKMGVSVGNTIGIASPIRLDRNPASYRTGPPALSKDDDIDWMA
jgi:crotonobetainyl-CoA:carnitine CoA-transferase CaiB-like acyl-CoA transferase